MNERIGSASNLLQRAVESMAFLEDRWLSTLAGQATDGFFVFGRAELRTLNYRVISFNFRDALFTI